MIDWKKYADYIFCIHYLPNNRLKDISKTLINIGIDINDSTYFSFMYDIEHKMFLNEYNIIYQNSFSYLNEITKLMYIYDQHLFYLGMITYKILKIAQYFKYERIIIFEDDLIFLKDLEYIKNTLNFVNTQNFDICSLQTTFLDCWHGLYEYISQLDYVTNLNNYTLFKTNSNLGVYSGGFLILTKNGINNIIDFFETNNVVICLDALEGRRHILNYEYMFILKPLCLQKWMLEIPVDDLMQFNANINLDEYNI